MQVLSDQRGAVTVFLVLIFSALLLVALVLVDAARVVLAQQMLQSALDSAGRSALAGCHEGMAAEFGLYGTRMPEAEMERYLRLNLQEQPGALRLLKFHDVSVEKETKESGSLLNDENLARQLSEYMKYKGPLVWAEEILRGRQQAGLKNKMNVLESGRQAAAAELAQAAQEAAAGRESLPETVGGIPALEDGPRGEVLSILNTFSFRELTEADLIEAGAFSQANALREEPGLLSAFFGGTEAWDNEAALQEGRRVLEYLEAWEEALDNLLAQGLEKFYQTEYILDKYTYLTSSTRRHHYLEKGEAEYILGGDKSELNNLVFIFEQILLFRLAVNTLDFFVKSPLPDPLARLSFALAEGFTAACLETARLYDGQYVALFPETPQLTLSYADYLRLFLLAQDEEIQLNRMRQLMQVNIRRIYQEDDFELSSLEVRGTLRASAEIDLWFLRPKQGRWRLEREAAFSY